jgi:hypothetical protein
LTTALGYQVCRERGKKEAERDFEIVWWVEGSERWIIGD